MVLLDLLGRRWTLRVLWELRETSLTFRAIQEATGGVSPSVLNGRLAELRDAGIVELGANGYALTHQGRSLMTALGSLTRWSESWSPPAD